MAPVNQEASSALQDPTGEQVVHAVEQQQGIPENAPTVSMDINLGKKYKSVDFDYAAYDKASDAIGLSENGRSQQHIHVTGPGRSLVNGVHSGEGHLISVKPRRDDKANNTLRHEMKHAADYENWLYRGKDPMYRAGLVAGKLIVPYTVLLAASAVGSVAGVPGAKETFDSALLGSPAVSYPSLAGYYFHPKEVGARNAAAATSEQILSFSKK